MKKMRFDATALSTRPFHIQSNRRHFMFIIIHFCVRAIISIGNYEFCLYSLTNLPFCVENLIYKILNHISIHWLIVQIL